MAADVSEIPKLTDEKFAVVSFERFDGLSRPVVRPVSSAGTIAYILREGSRAERARTRRRRDLGWRRAAADAYAHLPGTAQPERQKHEARNESKIPKPLIAPDGRGPVDGRTFGSLWWGGGRSRALRGIGRWLVSVQQPLDAEEDRGQPAHSSFQWQPRRLVPARCRHLASDMSRRKKSTLGVGLGVGISVLQGLVSNSICWDDLLAEGVGFEPTVRFHAHTLSKRAP